MTSQTPLLAGLENRRVVVVGDVMLDRYLWGEVNRISPEAPTPIVDVVNETFALGGAANVAMNLLGLGAKVALIGVVGDDGEGRRVAEGLRSRAVDSHIVVDAERPTTVKTRVFSQGQQLMRLDRELARPLPLAAERKLTTSLDQAVETADAVVLSDYAKGVFLGSLAQSAIRRAGSRKIPVLVDPKNRDWSAYRGASCIKPNRAEFRLAAGLDRAFSPEQLAEKAFELRRRFDTTHLLVTLGAQGMSLFGPDDTQVDIPAAAREVFDICGAGDTVVATLAAGCACGMDMLAAARTANLAAGVAVGKTGALPITLDELRAAARDVARPTSGTES